MARDVEKLELLFRRQIAFETARSPKRPVTYRVDAVKLTRGCRTNFAEFRQPPCSEHAPCCSASRPKPLLRVFQYRKSSR